MMYRFSFFNNNQAHSHHRKVASKLASELRVVLSGLVSSNMNQLLVGGGSSKVFNHASSPQVLLEHSYAAAQSTHDIWARCSGAGAKALYHVPAQHCKESHK
eukprot:m.16436 g.16436  ORF g.16436 m.16436 type:complete len:102 (-) comp10565_c0_seq1:609-914(-)